MSEKRPSALFIHLEHADLIRMLSDKDRGTLLLALLDYAETGEIPAGFKGQLLMCYRVLARAMERYAESYQRTCQRNREKANKRWHGGEAGALQDAAACTGMQADADDANPNPNPYPNPNPNLNPYPHPNPNPNPNPHPSPNPDSARDAGAHTTPPPSLPAFRTREERTAYLRRVQEEAAQRRSRPNPDTLMAEFL